MTLTRAGLCIAIYACSQPLQVRADPTADEIGFGDVAEPVAATPVEEPSPWTAGVALRLRAAVRVERLDESQPTRFANLKSIAEPHLEWTRTFDGFDLYARAALHAEADLAYLAYLDEYDAATRDEYAWQLWPSESYVGLSTGPFELRIGEQIVSFGQADILSPLDAINPRDLREPLLADVGELRLPVLMTRARLAFERISADVALIHEPYFGRLPPPLGEFSPFRKLLLDNDAIREALEGRSVHNRHTPSRNPTEFGATQLLGRVTWSAPSIDLAWIAGTLLDGVGVPIFPAASAFRARAFDLQILHPRHSLLGHSGAWNLGALVLRWEAVLELSRAIALQRSDLPLQLSAARRHQLRGVLSLLYAPSENLHAALEVAQAHVFDNPAGDPSLRQSLLYPVTATQLALRFQYRFLRERATVSLLMLRFGLASLNAWAGRVEAGYQLLDSLDLSLGFVTYQPTREFGYFYGLDHHDRVFLQLRWEVSS